MSRHGYIEDGDFDHWQTIMWRGSVASAIRGKRGQAFLREMVEALDAMPVKRLIEKELIALPPAFVPPSVPAQVCAIGSVGARRGVDMEKLDPENYDEIAAAFGISPTLVREIEFWNDDALGQHNTETPEYRWQRVRDWAVSKLKGP
jgi:hypothetical protein